jgi:hypothetical protein
MKHPIKRYLFLLPLLLTACETGGVRETLGLTRDAPDEFTVVSRPPLSLPPEFNLRPPRPGEAPRGIAADEQARGLLTGTKPKLNDDAATLEAPTVETAVLPVVRSDAVSGGAASLLKRAGADKADEDIRSKLSVDAVTPVDTSNAATLMDSIVGAEKNEPVVDAKKEAERIRANKDEKKPITEGEVPEEKSKARSLIDRIF